MWLIERIVPMLALSKNKCSTFDNTEAVFIINTSGIKIFFFFFTDVMVSQFVLSVFKKFLKS